MRASRIAKWLIGVGAALALVFGTATAVHGTESITKYDTEFTYLGDNVWSVTPLSGQFALHNIGAQQSWLCNQNNVGPGIDPCVPGKSYQTNGDLYADGSVSCVYVQGDAPAWDTVPGTEKEVCATVEPSPTPSTTTAPPIPTASPTPSATATPNPESTPTPVETPVSTPEPSGVPIQVEPPALAPVAPAEPTAAPVTTLAATGDSPWAGLAVFGVFTVLAGAILLTYQRLSRKKSKD